MTALLSGNLRDRPVFAYHAGMDLAARTSNQERFMSTPRAVAAIRKGRVIFTLWAGDSS